MIFGLEFGFQGGTGLGSGSSALANIIYNMDTFNVTDAGLNTIDNTGLDGDTSDAPIYSSDHIHLGAGQSVPYPIPYTLGSEDYTGSATVNSNGTATDLTASHNSSLMLPIF